MKKIFLLMAAVVAFAAVSCENDNLNPNPDKKFVKELTVNIVNEGSKVTVTEDASAIHFDWEGGDILYAYLAEEGKKSYVECFRYDAASEKFVADGEGLEAGKTYYVVRGATQMMTSYNDNGVVAYFQLYVLDEFEVGNLPMMSDQFVATSAGAVANLHHLVSIVDIPVVGTATISEIEFNAYNSTKDREVRGLFSVGFESDGTVGDITRLYSGAPYTSTYDADYVSSSVKLVLSATPQTLRYAVLPGDYNNIIMQAVPEGGYTTQGAVLGAKVIEPGKVYQMATPVTLTF